jgi:hypothetical protein
MSRPAPVPIRYGFDPDAVVDGSADPLLTGEITFCRLHGYMAKQKLNLVQLSTG